MEAFLIELATKYQVIMTICIVVGIFRLVFKPLVAIIKAVVVYTPSPKDDVIVAQVEASKVYKTVLWVIDYLLSIKLPGQK